MASDEPHRAEVQHHEEQQVQFETNVDDMDPRLWPGAIDALLAAGANDAWVTPIIMKKGRPAFSLGAMCDVAMSGPVRTAIFRETSTIGIREIPIRRYVLERTERSVEVDGRTIGVKTAYDQGTEVNRSVEWDDVVAAAESLGLSAKQVLDAATTAAHLMDTTDR